MVLGIFKIALHLRSACFYGTISESFKHFQYFNSETNVLENKNLFQKTGVPLKPLRLKTHHFHSKLLFQKPMLRQIEW